MLFNEIYSNYFNLVAEIVSYAVDGELNNEKLLQIVSEKGFVESIAIVPDSIKDGTWPLITPAFTTPILNKPTIPLSTLQKRWLKALLSDPRIALFEPEIEGLEDIEPLFSYDDLVYFDRYLDGDPYTSQAYIKHFRKILQAIRERRKLKIVFVSNKGKQHVWKDIPLKLEYSPKDDKFRVLIQTLRDIVPINVARIVDCKVMEECEAFLPMQTPEKSELTFDLTDERNALERVLLAFSDLEKTTEKIDKNHYRVDIKYDHDDETEILIRILSFGPVIKVISPDFFKEIVKERLNMQKRFASY